MLRQLQIVPTPITYRCWFWLHTFIFNIVLPGPKQNSRLFCIETDLTECSIICFMESDRFIEKLMYNSWHWLAVYTYHGFNVINLKIYLSSNLTRAFLGPLAQEMLGLFKLIKLWLLFVCRVWLWQELSLMALKKFWIKWSLLLMLSPSKKQI